MCTGSGNRFPYISNFRLDFSNMLTLCLGCLGCLKCLIPSFVPGLLSFALSVLMVTFFSHHNIKLSRLQRTWYLYRSQDLPALVIALLLAVIFTIPFVPQLLKDNSKDSSKRWCLRVKYRFVECLNFSSFPSFQTLSYYIISLVLFAQIKDIMSCLGMLIRTC